MKQVRSALLLALVAQPLPSCTPSPLSPGPDEPPPIAEGEGELPNEGEGEGEPCGLACVGTSGLVRLNRVQYGLSVKQIVGAVTIDANTLPEDVAFHLAFVSNDLDLAVDDTEKFLYAAEKIAAQLNVATVTGCATVGCVDEAIQSVGTLFHRGPLTATEVAGYRSIYDAEADHIQGLRSVLVSMMISPRFLYVPLVGVEVEPTVHRLNGRSLATRLALFLWQRTPDRDLLDKAANGELDTPEGLEAEVRRMLLDTRADQVMRTFHRQWLQAHDLASLGFSHPENQDYTAELAAAMGGEINRFTVDVFRNQGARLSMLLGGQYSFVNPELASFYGLSPVTAWTKVENIPHRRGILLQGGTIAANSSESWAHAVPRGLFVRRALLCQNLPSPGEVDRSPPPFSDEIHTDRHALERNTIQSGPACAGCHTVMNPPGYAFEHFSPAGKFRAEGPSYLPDADPTALAPLDASGDLGSVPGYESDADIAFADAEDLVSSLAASRDVARCMARQWTRFALGRVETPTADEPSALLAFEKFDAADHDLRELIVAIATSDSFLHRRPTP